MRNGTKLLILGVMVAAPLTARPMLQPFGGRSSLSYAGSGVESCHERVLLTLRNDGAAEIAYRLLWLDADRTLVGRSDPRRLAKGETVHLDVGGIARSLGVVWKGGSVEIEWASERFSRVTAVAAVVRDRYQEQDFEVVSPVPVHNEAPRPIRWAELQAISAR